MWVTMMQSQMFNFRQKPILKDAQGNFLKNSDGTYQYGSEQINRVQGSLRPFELWEYVFPKESLQEVLAMQNLQNAFPLRKEIQAPAWVLRKLMGCRQIPQEVIDAIKGKTQGEITQKYVHMPGMAAYPVGIKDDIIQDYIFDMPGGKIGFHQEGL
jgi:hypothetical protein